MYSIVVGGGAGDWGADANSNRACYCQRTFVNNVFVKKKTYKIPKSRLFVSAAAVVAVVCPMAMTFKSVLHLHRRCNVIRTSWVFVCLCVCVVVD